MNVHDPNPRTIASIRLQRLLVPNIPGNYECGCHRSPSDGGRWRLCQYHEGYEDGIEQFDVTVAEMTRQLDEARADAEQGWALASGLAALVRACLPPCAELDDYDDARETREAGR